MHILHAAEGEIQNEIPEDNPLRSVEIFQNAHSIEDVKEQLQDALRQLNPMKMELEGQAMTKRNIALQKVRRAMTKRNDALQKVRSAMTDSSSYSIDTTDGGMQQEVDALLRLVTKYKWSKGTVWREHQETLETILNYMKYQEGAHNDEALGYSDSVDKLETYFEHNLFNLMTDEDKEKAGKIIRNMRRIDRDSKTSEPQEQEQTDPSEKFSAQDRENSTLSDLGAEEQEQPDTQGMPSTG